MEIERRKRNLVFTDETFTCRCSVGCSHVAFRASQMPTQRRRRRPADAYWRLCGENYLLLSVSLSLFCPSFFRSSTIRSAATPAIWLRTFVVFGSWVPDATAVQVLRSFGPDLSLNAERSYQHFGISSSSFRREWLFCVIEFYSGTDHLSCSFFRR